MRLKRLEIIGFKSFAKKAVLDFTVPVSAIVGPNGSGKSNVAESMRFVLGEQSIKSMRGKKGEDMIFNGTEKLGRQNMARVTVVFDNADRAFKLDFDEVTVSREVFRDGTHQYYINNSQVRLKDVLELLSAVNIGASSHHIISQGEADRILSASLKERKSMIEDALGLKIYHWKIDESERKLLRTEENLKEIEGLRREIAPNLKFLKKQVEKAEKVESLRNELADRYKEYLKREDVYIKTAGTRIAENKRILQEKLGVIDDELARLVEGLKNVDQEDGGHAEAIRSSEEELRVVRNKKSDVARESGKLEGMIEYEERRKREAEHRRAVQESAASSTSLRANMQEVDELISGIEHVVSSYEHAPYERLVEILNGVKDSIVRFRQEHTGGQNSRPERPEEDDIATEELRQQLMVLQGSFNELCSHENVVVERISGLRLEMEKERGGVREAERLLYEKKAERAQTLSRLEYAQVESVRYDKEVTDLEEEIREGVSLIGGRIRDFHTFEISSEEIMSEPRMRQEERRREIERIKIRVEDQGLGLSDDVIKEHNDLAERDAFLEKEVNDLTASARSLREIIKDLNDQLETEFKSGVEKINTQFQTFFDLMFGGGNAALSVVVDAKRKQSDDDESLEGAEEETEETGIDISVSLPRKKIRGLQMLSGGERALTSIALLFAVSQVNPPPFMILDETDAALDEANSRKYGDMLENLSKFSQLIVITHNRETMSRAGVLYGVTMDGDATSKLLSIKLEEAVEIAK